MLYSPITMQFQVLFTRIAPYFSPFTHVTVRYRSRGVFRVGGYCPPGSREISNPRYSGVLLRLWKIRLRDYHPLWYGFPEVFDFFPQSMLEVPNTTSPDHRWSGFSLPYSHFTRRYYGNHNCFLFHRLIRCFRSAGCLTLRYDTTY